MEQNSITVTYILSGNFVGNFLSGEIMASRKATIWGPLLLSEKSIQHVKKRKVNVASNPTSIPHIPARQPYVFGGPISPQY